MTPTLEENATNTYLMNEGFASAVKRLRKALRASNVIITGELDLAARIWKALRITVPPCVILFASSSTWTAEDMSLDLTSAAKWPLHLVISARESKTEVHFLRIPPAPEEPSQRAGWAALAAMQAAISLVVETIGMRKCDI